MTGVGSIFNENLKVINIGIESFFDSMKDQSIPVVHVEWKPPAGGNEKLMDILEKLKK